MWNTKSTHLPDIGQCNRWPISHGQVGFFKSFNISKNLDILINMLTIYIYIWQVIYLHNIDTTHWCYTYTSLTHYKTHILTKSAFQDTHIQHINIYRWIHDTICLVLCLYYSNNTHILEYIFICRLYRKGWGEKVKGNGYGEWFGHNAITSINFKCKRYWADIICKSTKGEKITFSCFRIKWSFFENLSLIHSWMLWCEKFGWNWPNGS